MRANQFLLMYLLFSRSVMSNTLGPHGLLPARLLCPRMEFSRQEYWNRLPFPSPGDLPDLGIEPRSSALQADSLPAELQGKPTFTSLLLVIFQNPQHNYVLPLKKSQP